MNVDQYTRGNGGGKRPQYRVKLGPANSEGKVFWTDVGGAWLACLTIMPWQFFA